MRMNHPTDSQPSIELRSLQSGDIGWVIAEHARVYSREYGWNMRFEALVARICADYIDKHQPDWERAWVATLGEQIVGCAFVVRKSKTVAQLRMLIVSPQARGQGLGRRLSDECLNFARSKGYKKMQLWTNANLLSARAIYASQGFKLIQSEAYEGFGKTDLVSETWELVL
jgi:GNAT superfamily N-acetyltransferase